MLFLKPSFDSRARNRERSATLFGSCSYERSLSVMRAPTNRQASATTIERAARRLEVNRSNPATRADEGAVAGPAPRPGAAEAQVATSRVVHLDLARLRTERVITPDTIRSRTTEEMRLIKRQVLGNCMANTEGRSNLIMVTSALSGEGKTFVAINLAMSIAFEKDLRVLLVDADLAKPSLGGRLGLDVRYGLTDYLRTEHAQVSDFMLRTDINGLSLMPAGEPDELNTELLGSKRMAGLLQELSDRYPDRIIIFDSPPVLMATEASVLAGQMGQVVFVVQADKTKRVLVEEALELIKDAPNIGLIINQARYGWGSTDFGKYYGRYYGRQGSHRPPMAGVVPST